MNRSALIAVCAGIAAAASGCTETANPSLAGMNALISGFTTTVPGDETTATSASASVGAQVAYAQDGESIEVSWNNGPLAGKTRTFVQSGPGAFTLDDPDEEGLLVIARSTPNAVAVFGNVLGNASTAGAIGLAHTGIAPTNIPADGTLTYATSDGVLVQQATLGGINPCSGPAMGCVGDVSIAANFSSGAVNGTFSNFDNGLSDIGFSGTMNTGNALYSSTSITYGGAAATGTLIGGFYGPGAVDTAGVFDLTASSGTRYLGEYAATSAP